jgi:hypothetical protein
MSDSDYTEVEAESNIGEGSPDFYFKAEGRDHEELIYTFYKDKEKLPDYMIEHAKRDVEAKEVEADQKLPILGAQHLTEKPEKDWRMLE